MKNAVSAAPLPLTDLQLVDLSRHALIEASAGTGKTFTIEHLVVRLLMQDPDLRLENILLVTFTEKATGELKQRIRRQIERALDNDGTPAAMHQKLRATLDGFDHAAITTIHGFCHTLLKEFPFETGSLFQQEVIEDGPLMEQLLRGQMRRQWPARFGQHLETLLALSGFSDDPDGFIRRAVDLACRPWGDPAGEVVIPDPTRMNVERLWQRTRETLLRLKQQVGPPP
ncbi:MAG: UvrD-helicase domain-containing protein, partial [Desulfosarcina sp.]